MPDYRIGDQLPTGSIIMWHSTIATIPKGWALCNGSNGTPDLRNRFVIAADADSGGAAKTTINGGQAQSGGSVDHTHSFTSDGHVHDLSMDNNPSTTGGDTPVSTTTNSQNDVGSTGGSIENPVPPYFALAFIMKL